MAAIYTACFLNNECSIRVYQSFVAIFKSIFYYAGIMLNAFSNLLCSKLCWHNRLVPTALAPSVSEIDSYVLYVHTNIENGRFTVTIIVIW